MRSLRERGEARKYAILALSLHKEGKFVMWVGRLISILSKHRAFVSEVFPANLIDRAGSNRLLLKRRK